MHLYCLRLCGVRLTCVYVRALARLLQAERRAESAALLASLAEAGVLDVLPLPGGSVAGAWPGLSVRTSVSIQSDTSICLHGHTSVRSKLLLAQILRQAMMHTCCVVCVCAGHCRAG